MPLPTGPQFLWRARHHPFPAQLVGKSLHSMVTGSPCLPFSASWRPFASFERHSSSLVLQLLLSSGQASPLPGSGVLCSSSTQRDGGLLPCKAQSPHRLVQHGLVGWTGRHRKGCLIYQRTAGSLGNTLAKPCFSPIPIYSLQHAVSCEVGPRKPKSSKILLCLSNLTIASIQITFFMFYRNCPVRPKEQLRDFLRD